MAIAEMDLVTAREEILEMQMIDTSIMKDARTLQVIILAVLKNMLRQIFPRATILIAVTVAEADIEAPATAIEMTLSEEEDLILTRTVGKIIGLIIVMAIEAITIGTIADIST